MGRVFDGEGEFSVTLIVDLVKGRYKPIGVSSSGISLASHSFTAIKLQ